MTSRLKAGLVIGIGVVSVATAAWMLAHRTQKSENVMTPEEVESLIRRDSTAVLLDVRTPVEWNSNTGHLKDAVLIPVQELEQRLDELDVYKERTLVVYCRSGNRSGRANALLNERGFVAYNMAGGIVRWNAEQRPVVLETQQ